MSDIYNSPGALMLALQSMISGFATSPPAGLTHLAVSGKVSSIADLTIELQGYADVYKTADEADKAHEKAVLARDAIEPTATTRYEELRAAIKSALGKKNPDLHNFGLTPSLRHAHLTVEQQAIKVAKTKATRAARHTLGPKQRKAIKGQLPPVAEQTPPPASKPSV